MQQLNMPGFCVSGICDCTLCRNNGWKRHVPE